MAGSGLASSVWAIAFPASFLDATHLPAALVEDFRFFFSILGMLAVLALQGAVLGTRVLKVKDRSEPLRHAPLAIVLTLQLLGSLALGAYGAVSLVTSGFESRYYVTLAIAILALLDYWEQRKYVTQPQPPRAWFYKHLECMMGCGIAFYTAASVTFFGRIVQLDLAGPLALIPWLLPAAIGVPAIHFTKRHYRRRFSGPHVSVVGLNSGTTEAAESR